jgi:hypothetical protein
MYLLHARVGNLKITFLFHLRLYRYCSIFEKDARRKCITFVNRRPLIQISEAIYRAYYYKIATYVYTLVDTN